MKRRKQQTQILIEEGMAVSFNREGLVTMGKVAKMFEAVVVSFTDEHGHPCLACVPRSAINSAWNKGKNDAP